MEHDEHSEVGTVLQPPPRNSASEAGGRLPRAEAHITHDDLENRTIRPIPTLARALPSYHSLGETLLASIQTFGFAFMQTVPVCHDQIP